MTEAQGTPPLTFHVLRLASSRALCSRYSSSSRVRDAALSRTTAGSCGGVHTSAGDAS